MVGLVSSGSPFQSCLSMILQELGDDFMSISVCLLAKRTSCEKGHILKCGNGFQIVVIPEQ